MVVDRFVLHKQALVIILSKTFGILFLASAFLKFYGLQTFQGEVRLYLEVYFPSVFIGHERILAISTCLLELVMGLYALIGIMRKRLSVVYVAVMSFFIWLTGINLFFPSLMGSIESCGCFGELIHFTPTESFTKSVVLWLLSLVWSYLEYVGNRKKTLCYT
jgi:uncharacterized membrane protein YphA (DoxX/SURF4 family)